MFEDRESMLFLLVGVLWIATLIGLLVRLRKSTERMDRFVLSAVLVATLATGGSYAMLVQGRKDIGAPLGWLATAILAGFAVMSVVQIVMELRTTRARSEHQ